MSTPQAFNLQALIARVQTTRIAAPAPLVMSAHRMQVLQTRAATRNVRTVTSIIEESDEIECFEYSHGETLTIAE